MLLCLWHFGGTDMKSEKTKDLSIYIFSHLSTFRFFIMYIEIFLPFYLYYVIICKFIFSDRERSQKAIRTRPVTAIKDCDRFPEPWCFAQK